MFEVMSSLSWGGGIRFGNVASQALMADRISDSQLAGAKMAIPKGRPLYVAYPSGTVPTGYPARAAIVAERPVGGPIMRSISFSWRVLSIPRSLLFFRRVFLYWL